jgi:hypothetical protein
MLCRDEFESNAVDYMHHIKDEHNMWKYAWLQLYLREKDPLLFTGPEYFAYEQMQDKQVVASAFTTVTLSIRMLNKHNE